MARSESTGSALGMDGSLQAASAAFITVRGTPTSMMAEEDMAVDGRREVDNGHRFCYLGDILGTEGGADAAGTDLTCTWKKYNMMAPFLTSKETSQRITMAEFTCHLLVVWMRVMGHEGRV